MNYQSIKGFKSGAGAQLQRLATKSKWWLCLKRFSAGFSICLFAGFIATVSAQTGHISGKVTDSVTGESISGTQIYLSNQIQKYSGEQGEYEFTEIPVGSYILGVYSPGYERQEVKIEVSSGEKNVQNLELNGQTIEEQRRENFSAVLTPAQINSFGDFSVKDALVRMPGVQVSREGDINIRGTGYDSYNVTVNGQRLSSTGFVNRSVDLGTISSDAIREIELLKVITPDKDADALAGIVNLHINQIAGDERKLSARAGGGANTQYLSRTDPDSRAWLNYSERFQEDLSVALTLSYQDDYQGWEDLGLNYGVEDFGNGPVDVVEQVSAGLHINGHKRFGGTLNLQYDPTEEVTYFLRGFVSTDNQENVSHTDSWIPNGDWIDQFTTGAEGDLGIYSHDARHQNVDIVQSVLQAGGQHDFESFELTYNAGWSQSIVDNKEYLFPFQIDRLNFEVDWENRSRPTMVPTNRPSQIMEDGSIDRRYMIGQDFERIIEEHSDNELSARVDFSIPFSFGSVKAGSSARVTTKNAEYDENFFEYNRTLRMVGFIMLKEPNRNIDVLGEDYRLPWLVNTSDARAFFENQRPVFTGDQNLRRSRSDILNFNSSENIYAGYAMTDLEFGNLQFIGGARLEFTSSEYTGNQVDFDDTGNFISSEEVVETGDDFRLFPHAQLVFNATGQNSVRFAYSSTISRPDFQALVPFERVNHLDSTIYRGNPGLEAVTADNLDLMLRHEFNEEGEISIGAFYKNLANFIVEREEETGGGDVDGYQERFFQNSNQNATIYGAEVAWQQRFVFLPGLWNNFGLFANYTWSASEFETGRGDEIAFPGQSPHVVNAALDYTHQRFSARLSYHWSAELMSQLEQESRLAPSVNASGEVYMDRYQDGYQDLSASFTYRLSKHFQVWAHVNNLLRNEQVEHSYNRSFYPTNTYLRDGLELKMGIRFDL